MIRVRALVPCLLAVAALQACRKDEALPMEADDAFTLDLPPGAPMPPIPAENALTATRVALGKALFFDERLSLGRGVSCASCHHPDKAFSDTVALSTGVNGGVGFRNAPSLANVAYHPAYFRDGGVPTLELQVLAPIQDPVEMDADINVVTAQLAGVEPYRTWSREAYGRDLDAFVITRAIACYERTLISGWSRFDRFRYGNEPSALTPEELQGWAVFSGAEADCIACHDGFDLSDHSYQNIGLSLDHSADPGRERITLRPEDRGKFKTPTLRNIARTAPYMHDGSMGTLEQVIDHFAGGGVADPNKSPLVHSFSLSSADRQALIAFLHALTDERPLDQVP